MIALDDGPDTTPWTVLHLSEDPASGTWRPLDGRTLDPASGHFVVFWRNGFPVGSRIVPPGSASDAALAGPDRSDEDDAPPQTSPLDRERLSLVIPTRDRPQDLARCLAALSDQTCPPDEVVVVDNASATPETERVVRAAGHVYVREERPGLDLARNAGIRASRHALIAFCDDDVVLHAQWCREMRRSFADPQVEAVTGLVLPLELETPAQRLFEFEWGFGRGFRPLVFGPDFFARTRSVGCPAWEFGAGASMGFRRSLFERVGLFDERLDAGAAGCSGDSEMWYRVVAEGGTCLYNPRIVGFHQHRSSDEALLRQLRAYMRGHVVALLVQFQRYGHWGNLYRALFVIPGHYGARAARVLLRRRKDPTLADEIRGYAEGFLYFARHRRLSTPLLASGVPEAAR